MPQSWSSIRKKLEQDLLCESLKNRVQYFRTNYHGAPDDYGRFAVRIDGKEVFQANPYNEMAIFRYGAEVKREQNIPGREWTDDGEIINQEVNLAAEEEGRIRAAEDGIVDSCLVPYSIKKYLNQDIKDSIADEDPVIRMLAIFDRRVGKRTLRDISKTVQEQPEWLQEFYRLRLDAEGIAY